MAQPNELGKNEKRAASSNGEGRVNFLQVQIVKSRYSRRQRAG